MNKLLQLEPDRVWFYFDKITQIPRPSKHETKIIAYLEEYANAKNLAFKKDAVGNVVLSKPASKGYEHKPVVVLQSHVDMVCEKNSDVHHDFNRDPIQAYIDNGWVKAKGTTLGADDGIGIAMMLAVLEDTSLLHGPLECLFTVDEETGLTGAFNLQPGFITGEILINIDSEDEGEIFIGCAGGKDTLACLPVHTSKSKHDTIAFNLSITGLKGGHSGDDIHRGLGNAIKILGDILFQANHKFQIEINRFEGGNLRNAIPREAFASVLIEPGDIEAFHEFIGQTAVKLTNQYAGSDAGIKLTVAPLEPVGICLDKPTKTALLHAVTNCPNGVIAWSKDIEGLVETSTNLASIKFEDNEKIIITTSQRSASNTERDKIVLMVTSVFEKEGMQITHSDGYPGWAPNKNSPLLAVAGKTYEKLFGKKPLVKAIHAGLECGLFLEKNPKLDMISIGPTIKGVHSPDERLEIHTVKMTWEFLLDILKNV